MGMSPQSLMGIKDAINTLRDTLSFAARVEHPMIICTLSKTINDLNNLQYLAEIYEPLTTDIEGAFKNKHSSSFKKEK